MEWLLSNEYCVLSNDVTKKNAVLINLWKYNRYLTGMNWSKWRKTSEWSVLWLL